MSAGLTGSTAIVTGANAGIGAAVARAFVEAGASVVLAARREQELRAVAERLDAPGRVLAYPADVTDEEQVAALFAAADATFGPVDILVNNAGTVDHTPTEALDLATWRRVLDVNLTAAFLCAREALRRMKPRKRGRIVNIGSVSAQMPRPDTIAYAASKFGLDGLTRSLALDGRAHGITASIVHPGVTATTLTPGMDSLPPDRVMQAEDIARIVRLIADLPPEMNMLETIALPIGQPYLGRG